MRPYLLTVILVIFGINSYSQEERNATIKGVITAKETGETLIGANVILKKDPGIGASTDIVGNYSLKLKPGEHILLFSFTGMKTDTVSFMLKANEIRNFDIALSSYDEVLETFEIKVGKFDQKIEDMTVSIETIKPDIIENKNTRSVETILDQTPGLNILDGEPQIRGGSGFTFGVGSKVAVLVDGMPMLSGDAGRPEWGFIPVENIEQIEVIKGASSVLSGASALSGAIHIRTAYPKDKPLTKVNAYTGFYSAPRNEAAQWWDDYPTISGVNFLHSRKIKNFDLVVGGNFNYDHGYIGAPQPGEFVVDTISDFTDDQMRSIRGRVNFNLRHRSKKVSGLNYGLNGNFMLNSTNLALAWLNDSSGIYRAYPGAVFLQEQQIGYLDPFINFYSETGAKHSLKGRVLRTNNEMTNNQSNESWVYFADYQFQKEYDFIEDLKFIGGVSSQYTDSYAELYAGAGSPENQLLNISGYTEIQKKFYDVLNFSIGGRAEYYQLNDTTTALAPIFRAGSSIKLAQETYFRMSYGQGYRFPTITERYISTSAGSFGVFSNPGLQPEKSWNSEAGIKQGLKFGNYFGYLDVAVFWQEYENTIEYLFGFWDLLTVPGFKFVNTGESRVVGIDISWMGQAKIGKNWRINTMLGYNYILPETLTPDYVYAVDQLDLELSYNTTSLDTTGNILKYRFIHNAKGDIEVKWKDFAVGYSFRYFSRMENLDLAIEQFELVTSEEFSGGTQQPIRYLDFYNENNSGNLIMDARISYNWKEHKFALISSNIANRTYSLRPLKVEQMRTIMFQYSLKL